MAFYNPYGYGYGGIGYVPVPQAPTRAAQPVQQSRAAAAGGGNAGGYTTSYSPSPVSDAAASMPGVSMSGIGNVGPGMGLSALGGVLGSALAGTPGGLAGSAIGGHMGGRTGAEVGAGFLGGLIGALSPVPFGSVIGSYIGNQMAAPESSTFGPGSDISSAHGISGGGGQGVGPGGAQPTGAQGTSFGLSSGGEATGDSGDDGGDGDGGGGGGGGSKVICTAIHSHGLMPDGVFHADQEFGRRMMREDCAVMAGYHVWAKPIARFLSRHRWAAVMAAPLVLPWANHLAGKRNLIGAIYMKIGVPLCRFIGNRRSIYKLT